MHALCPVSKVHLHLGLLSALSNLHSWRDRLHYWNPQCRSTATWVVVNIVLAWMTVCAQWWGNGWTHSILTKHQVNHRVLAEKCWQSHLSNWSTLYTKGSHRYTGVRKGLIQVCKAQERVNKGLLMVQKGCLKQCSFFFFLNNLPSFQEYFLPASAQTGRWVLKSWPHRHSASRTGPSCIPCCTHSGRTPWCWGSGRSHRHLACWSTRQCLHKGKHSTADDIS